MATLTPSVGLLTSTVSTFAETTGNTDTTLTLSGDSKMTGMVSASDITALTAESAVTNGNILTFVSGDVEYVYKVTDSTNNYLTLTKINGTGSDAVAVIYESISLSGEEETNYNGTWTVTGVDLESATLDEDITEIIVNNSKITTLDLSRVSSTKLKTITATKAEMVSDIKLGTKSALDTLTLPNSKATSLSVEGTGAADLAITGGTSTEDDRTIVHVRWSFFYALKPNLHSIESSPKSQDSCIFRDAEHVEIGCGWKPNGYGTTNPAHFMLL